MRSSISIISAVCCVCFLPQAHAQNTNAPARRFNGPNVSSPQLHLDHSVTFQILDRNATNVTVNGEWGGGDIKLTKDAQGVWSVTTLPIRPGIFGYSFKVDGFETLDPSDTQLKPARSFKTSILEIPGDHPLPFEFQDVPHGTVHSHAYFSTTLNKRRNLTVYTPPGYEHSRDKYPVLFLLHGSGDNDATWTQFGRANWILDNLLSEHFIRPMVVVMTDGHAVVGPQAGGGTNRNANVEAYGRDLLTDVLPLVEKTYRVRKSPEDRAIAGLSMGGGQSLNIGLTHPEIFGWVGGFSSAVNNPAENLKSVFNLDDKFNKKRKLIWIACGKDDSLMRANRDLDALLTEKGVKHHFVETEGAHAWPVWRKNLVDFAPLLFVK